MLRAKGLFLLISEATDELGLCSTTYSPTSRGQYRIKNWH